jgi:hypothetical protein
MKENSKLVIAGIAITFIAVFAASAQKINIDYRYNLGSSDPANDYFSWTNPKDGKVIKDSFDASSGASKSGSASGFDAVRFDGTANARKTLPAGLRGLLLYPSSPRSVFAEDALTVTPVGKEFQIRYVHRGTAYQGLTKGGKLDIGTDFTSASGLTDTIAGESVIKEQYRKAGTDGTKMSDLDWNKIKLVSDAAAPDAAKKAAGTLTTAYRNNILTLKGTLTLK